MAHAHVSLGANLGDRQRSLEAAVAALEQLEQTRLLAVSGWHETPPVGGPPGQQPFLNGAVTLETSLSPLALLAELQRIEHQQKRQRHQPWAARTLDLDLLLYDELELDTPPLTLPHPRMAFRRFVLAPASEIAADWRHPTTGWTVAQLLVHLDTAADYVAIGGVCATARQQLAAEILMRFSGKLIHAHGADLLVCQPTRGADIPVCQASAEPSGRQLHQAIELLDRQADWLQSADLSTRLLLSDFWFGQLLAEAALRLNEAALAEFTRHWHERNRQIVQPKLIVWLRDLPEHDEALERSELVALANALGEPLRRPGWGPVLKVGQGGVVSPLDEVAAAIEAMA
jgi:2-amino-4-hydroxy-6-hydroxymethyldihydropteridine diphosphokinase